LQLLSGLIESYYAIGQIILIPLWFLESSHFTPAFFNACHNSCRNTSVMFSFDNKVTLSRYNVFQGYHNHYSLDSRDSVDICQYVTDLCEHVFSVSIQNSNCLPFIVLQHYSSFQCVIIICLAWCRGYICFVLLRISYYFFLS